LQADRRLILEAGIRSQGSGSALLAAFLAASLGWAQERVAIDAPAGRICRRDPVEMAAVPSGDFLMGSDDPEADLDERPVARIHVEAFWIDRVEVTNARYGVCVEAGACSLPVGIALGDATKVDHPVTIVSWTQAAAYCRWVGKRLPTEAEWEKAARGVDGRRYPWGSRFEAGRVNAGYTAGTAAVGGYPGGASPYGLLDMAGNVWEWTSSLYRPYPYDPGDGREDPTGRGARVNRGGNWYYGAWYVRTTYRATADHIYRRIADLGFRCASSRASVSPSSFRREAMPDRKADR
jgi:formylglycine-generating enzyme required for sulfatase activity